jgi:hypothetical protein
LNEFSLLFQLNKGDVQALETGEEDCYMEAAHHTTTEDEQQLYEDTAEMQENIYAVPGELTPDNTGLELPDGVALKITSEKGQELLLKVRDGQISQDKAIEMVRDLVNNSDYEERPPSSSSKTSTVIPLNGCLVM